MSDEDALIAEINGLLRSEVDAAYLVKIRELVPSEETVMGVRVPRIKVLVKVFHQKYTLSLAACVDLLDALFQRQIREEILFGIFLLEKHKRHFTMALFDKADGWVDLIGNWEVCDQLATRIVVVMVAKELSLLSRLLTWTESGNLWRRRMALAVMTAMNQKGRSHVVETLQVVGKVMQDEALMVQKAAGWALREASKKDEQQVFAFLQQWQGKGNRRIMREGAQKLSPELRGKLFA